MKPPRVALACLVLLNAACGGTDARFLIGDAAPQAETRVFVRSIEVREVALPEYAAASEIVAEDADGALRPLTRAVWAGDPVRDVTSALARRLDLRSSAVVATEPWPLSGVPDATLDVRIDEMVARADGTFLLSGQYAIASPDGLVRERLERFSLSVPLNAATLSAGTLTAAPAANPAAVGVATGRALDALAGEILSRLKR